VGLPFSEKLQFTRVVANLRKSFFAQQIKRFPADARAEQGKTRSSQGFGCTASKVYRFYRPAAWYDGAIMMAKTQITLETEMQRRARQRANDLGVSLAEYFRRLLARDLARPETVVQVDRIFDLGASGGSDIASHKDSMVAEAFRSTRRKPRRR
jgi:hypothetical protein